MRIFFCVFMVVIVLIGSLFMAGCTSLINQHDVAFLSSLQEFQNEIVNRISQINENVRIQDWDAARLNLEGYQGIVKGEIEHLQSIEVSEKIIPIRDKALTALQHQEAIIQDILVMPELNASAISNLTGDYLADIIKTAIISNI